MCMKFQEYESAEEYLKRLLELQPQNKQAQQLFTKLRNVTRESDAKYKAILQKMFPL